MIGGVDFIPLGELPEGVPVATNGGGYAESMAEHALTMALAAAKRLVLEHENLKRGQFNQLPGHCRTAADEAALASLRC
jgi:phosphoglycerate dehydrogenase-like enzyme